MKCGHPGNFPCVDLFKEFKTARANANVKRVMTRGLVFGDLIPANCVDLFGRPR